MPGRGRQGGRQRGREGGRERGRNEGRECVMEGGSEGVREGGREGGRGRESIPRERERVKVAERARGSEREYKALIPT